MVLVTRSLTINNLLLNILFDNNFQQLIILLYVMDYPHRTYPGYAQKASIKCIKVIKKPDKKNAYKSEYMKHTWDAFLIFKFFLDM